MNTTLKHWKEAATLILAAGHKLGAERLSSRTPLTAAAGALQDGGGGNGRFDYNVLMLKRSSASTFMPNAYVFPGGTVHSSDFSSDWLDVFKSFSHSPNFGLRGVTQTAESRPPMFATDRRTLGSPVPGEVAFRICALRETFEESGVLLCVSKREESSLLRSLGEREGPLRYKANDLCGRELDRWRDLVNQNPANFIQMCRELEVWPNIWALHEWSNWLTPAGRYGVKRFDTAFFICCLQEVPHALQDEKEIVSLEWSTPSELLQSYRAQELWLAPPQVYELSRMCHVPRLKDLHDFSRRRGTEGCEQLLPVVSLKHEPYTALLPGDGCYPSAAPGEAGVGTSADPQPEDPREEDPALHRIVTLDPYNITLQITIAPKYNHLLPVSEPTSPQDSKSRL
ncbi:Nucleoside diphosphate-linked moiety X motif 19 [Liparis tanakae]|uniref:Acyl-coenzyme A diphosphatase NUDT19 n=1 Tax=Liparis tanakae TaxID=230148 RepID=A0A4Z2GRC5_9TELE|nr:Nucleoside diphosphate-linked moiety X motif 19 [Liparis tanakae]